MITTEQIPISKADIDLKRSFEFDGITVKLRLRKNKLLDFFTMDVFDESDVIIYTGRLSYKTEFDDSRFAELPFQFVPFDINEFFNPLEAETEITDDNLGVEVKLLISVDI